MTSAVAYHDGGADEGTDFKFPSVHNDSPLQPGSPAHHRVDLHQLCAHWEKVLWYNDTIDTHVIVLVVSCSSTKSSGLQSLFVLPCQMVSIF